MEENFGELTRRPGYVTAVMERVVDSSAEEVWQMLSDEANRVKWLAQGSIELEVGGRAQLDFKDSYVTVDSVVTACARPEVLEFSWSGQDEPIRPIRFELSEHEGGCLIRLTVSIPEDEVVPRSCAGWEAHLTMMQAALAGASVNFPLDRFKACRAFYESKLAALMMADYQVLRL